MAETLRDLVVSLSLQTDNFTRNIKSVNKQIAEAESQFKLAASGVEGFERSATGLATQLSTLERRLSLQKDAVTQYERALSAANDKLQECFSRQNDYAQRLTDAKTAQQALKEQVAAAAQQVRTYSATLGENDSATIAVKANLDALKAEYRNSCAEVKKLTGQNTALKKTTQNAADAVTDATTKLNTAQAAVRSTQAEINQCNQSLRLAQTNWDATGKSIDASKAAIVTFGKQIELAESRFKLATVGIKDMDTSVTGLAAKLTLLNDKLRLQEQSVQQYENALRGAKEQLAAAQQANDPEKIRQASDAVIDAEAALNRAKAAVASTRAEIAKANQQLNTAKSAWTEAGKNLEAFGKKCDSVSKKMTAAGRTLTTVMTTPILGLGATAVKASIGFESSFASVRKTVDATEAEFDQLAATSKRMSTEVAAGTNEINEVMAAGGQLGVATEHLSDFTRVMIDLGNSCEDLSADEAATTIAQLANIMGTSQSQFSNIGSTLVDLGNNFATTEKPIMEMAHRMAGAGKQVGLTEAQVLGFAAALSSVGIEAQMGGSAFSKALVKMEVASETGGEALDDFGKVAGMTAQQFKTLWDNDPAAAFQAFIVGLSKLDDEGESAIKTLSDIGINEIRLRDTLLRATNATELFSRAQNMANAAWKENTALTNEAGKRYSTTASKLTNLKNKALLFGQQIGDNLNPTIQSLIEGADNLLSKFLQMDEAQRKQIIQYAAIAAAIGPVLLLFGKVTKGIGSISTGIGKFATAVGKAGGGIKGFLSVLGSSPAVWLAVAAATIYATVAIADYVSGAKKAREALKGMQETADKWKSTAAETFYGNSEGLSFFGMSKEDFVKDKQSAQEWLNGLIAVWADGEKESNEIVAHWTDSFKSLTDSTRTELQALKDTADKSGYRNPNGTMTNYTGWNMSVSEDLFAHSGNGANIRISFDIKRTNVNTSASSTANVYTGIWVYYRYLDTDGTTVKTTGRGWYLRSTDANFVATDGDWVRMQYGPLNLTSFHPTSIAYFTLGTGGSNGVTGTVQFRNIKLEVLDRWTAWSAAPEDLYGMVSRMVNAESRITQNANNIALKVSTSTYNTEKVYRGSTAPTTLYTNMLWLDTSATPNLLKRYTGSAWVAAGAQEVKSSGIYIGPNNVAITTENFLLQLLDPANNENVLMEMSANGNVGFKQLYADEVVSNSVASAYGGPIALHVNTSYSGASDTYFRSLGDAVKAVNNRFLRSDVYIYLPNGTGEIYEPAGTQIQGVSGSGKLIIYGYANSRLNSFISVKGCSAHICFQNVSLREIRTLNGSNRNPYLIDLQMNHHVEMNSCTLDANNVTYDSIYCRTTHVYLYNCGLYNALQGLEVYMGWAYMQNCKGSCSWSMVSYAGYIICSGSVPSGSRNRGNNGQIYDTGVTIDYGTAIPVVTPDNTALLYATTTKSYRGGWRSDTLDVIQGVYSDSGYKSSLNWNYGCMWFGNLRSMLSGTTIKSATLTLNRKTGSGSGSAKTLYLCAITNASPSGYPAIAASYGAIGTIGRGETATFSVPVSAIQNLASGAYGALCLYESPYNFGSSTYSGGYMRMSGTDTNNPPYLRVVYNGGSGVG